MRAARTPLMSQLAPRAWRAWVLALWCASVVFGGSYAARATLWMSLAPADVCSVNASGSKGSATPGQTGHAGHCAACVWPGTGWAGAPSLTDGALAFATPRLRLWLPQDAVRGDAVSRTVWARGPPARA